MHFTERSRLQRKDGFFTTLPASVTSSPKDNVAEACCDRTVGSLFGATTIAATLEVQIFGHGVAVTGFERLNHNLQHQPPELTNQQQQSDFKLEDCGGRDRQGEKRLNRGDEPGFDRVKNLVDDLLGEKTSLLIRCVLVSPAVIPHEVASLQSPDLFHPAGGF